VAKRSKQRKYVLGSERESERELQQNRTRKTRLPLNIWVWSVPEVWRVPWIWRVPRRWRAPRSENLLGPKEILGGETFLGSEILLGSGVRRRWRAPRLYRRLDGASRRQWHKPALEVSPYSCIMVWCGINFGSTSFLMSITKFRCHFLAHMLPHDPIVFKRVPAKQMNVRTRKSNGYRGRYAILNHALNAVMAGASTQLSKALRTKSGIKDEHGTCSLGALHGLPGELTEELLRACQRHMWTLIYMDKRA